MFGYVSSRHDVPPHQERRQKVSERFDDAPRGADLRDEGRVIEREGGRRDFSAPLGEVTRGRLEFSRGTANLFLRVDAGIPDLFRAHFEGVIPDVEARTGAVTIRYPHVWPLDWLRYVLSSSRLAADVTLNGSIPWRIAIRGGVARLSGDLSLLRLEEFEIGSGASGVELTLPRPASVVPIHIGGGASHVTLRRTDGVAARVRIGGGVARLAFDAQRFGAIGGPLRLETPGYVDTADRYDIEIAGGAANLTETSPPQAAGFQPVRLGGLPLRL